MIQSKVRSLAFLPIVLLLYAPVLQAQVTPETATAGEKDVGQVIDRETRDKYHLFPGTEGFVSARFLVHNESTFRLEITSETPSGIRTEELRLSPQLWETTQQHIKLVDRYYQLESQPQPVDHPEVWWHYRMALKYAARARYDLAKVLFVDLFQEYPQARTIPTAIESNETVAKLADLRRALFLPMPLFERSGRTNLLVFSGYYGLWLGIATPVALEADSPQEFAVSLILLPSASIALTWTLTNHSDMTNGRASMISLGGHLGTWQGIGWAAVGDNDAEAPLQAGIVGGLVGITAATLLTRNVEIEEGHGAISGLALPWGIWYGLVIGAAGDKEGDELLRTTLIASDVAVLAAIASTRNVQMSRGRARVISLIGVAGAAFGFGLDLMGEVDDDAAVMLIPGIASAAGLALGVHITRNYDEGRLIGHRGPGSEEIPISIGPRFGWRQSLSKPTSYVPTLNLVARF